MCDIGLCPGNYFDYADDDVAIQREDELVSEHQLNHPHLSPLFSDTIFPSDARALYYDPFNPSSGSLPGESVVWRRVSDSLCEKPVSVVGDKKSSYINQGNMNITFKESLLKFLKFYSYEY